MNDLRCVSSTCDSWVRGRSRRVWWLRHRWQTSDGVLRWGGHDQEQLTDEKHVRLAREMHERWQRGEPKSRLEIEYWGKGTAHGKAFSGYVRRWLGIETERQPSQSARIANLEALLRANGISPTEAGQPQSTVSTRTPLTRTPDKCRRTDITSDIEASWDRRIW